MSEAIRRGIQAINRERRPLLIDDTPAPYKMDCTQPAVFVDYLENIKPLCRVGADFQQVIDDFQDFSNAIDSFKSGK